MATKGFPPVFSLGKSNAEEVGNITAAGTTITALAGVASYPVGTHVWVSESDYTGPVYRGKVTVQNIGGEIITVEIAAPGNITSPKCWKPTSVFAPTYDVSSPVRRRRALGIHTDTALDGTVYRTQVATAIEFIPLMFLPAKIGDVDDWWTFVEDEISDGVDRFTLSWYDWRKEAQRVCTVVLMDPDTAIDSRNVNLSNFMIEVAIQVADTYL